MIRQIEIGETFTTTKLKRIRRNLARILRNKNYAVVTGGSYARGEASEESDLDYFLICDSKESRDEAQKDLPRIKAELKKTVKKNPATDGAFGECEVIDEMCRNIGGQLDDNRKITRRILFLLEGQWLYNRARFLRYRERVIRRYINDKISDHQFCRFLLNDLIRYYRTICVDFEHKTKAEQKAWGIRNIKLIFSRKLLYFSGILVAAETWQQTPEVKVEKIRNLLTLTPFRRIQSICGSNSDLALTSYEKFLNKLGESSTRAMLEKTGIEKSKQSPEFRDQKNDGHHFSWMLVKLLRDTYDESHPIHNALVV